MSLCVNWLSPAEKRRISLLEKTRTNGTFVYTTNTGVNEGIYVTFVKYKSIGEMCRQISQISCDLSAGYVG